MMETAVDGTGADWVCHLPDRRPPLLPPLPQVQRWGAALVQAAAVASGLGFLVVDLSSWESSVRQVWKDNRPLRPSLFVFHLDSLVLSCGRPQKGLCRVVGP